MVFRVTFPLSHFHHLLLPRSAFSPGDRDPSEQLKLLNSSTPKAPSMDCLRGSETQGIQLGLRRREVERRGPSLLLGIFVSRGEAPVKIRFLIFIVFNIFCMVLLVYSPGYLKNSRAARAPSGL